MELEVSSRFYLLQVDEFNKLKKKISLVSTALKEGIEIV